MIIKFIKDTKTNRKGQVVEGDYKILIKAVKKGDADVSDEYELANYKARLAQAHQKKLDKVGSPLPPNQKAGRRIPVKAPCVECEKKKKAKSKNK